LVQAPCTKGADSAVSGRSSIRHKGACHVHRADLADRSVDGGSRRSRIRRNGRATRRWSLLLKAGIQTSCDNSGVWLLPASSKRERAQSGIRGIQGRKCLRLPTRPLLFSRPSGTTSRRSRAARSSVTTSVSQFQRRYGGRRASPGADGDLDHGIAGNRGDWQVTASAAAIALRETQRRTDLGSGVGSRANDRQLAAARARSDHVGGSM